MFTRPLVALRRRAHAEDGQALAEYGLIMALVVIVCLIAVAAIGVIIAMNFDSITGAL